MTQRSSTDKYRKRRKWIHLIEETIVKVEAHQNYLQAKYIKISVSETCMMYDVSSFAIESHRTLANKDENSERMNEK